MSGTYLCTRCITFIEKGVAGDIVARLAASTTFAIHQPFARSSSPIWIYDVVCLDHAHLTLAVLRREYYFFRFLRIYQKFFGGRGFTEDMKLG